MYAARIENEELVLQKIGRSANDDESICVNLSNFFISAQSGVNDAYINARLQPHLPGRHHIMLTGNIKINELFNQASGFISVDTLDYTIPMGLVTKSKDYGHNLLSQALKNGVQQGSTITVKHEGDLPNGLGEEYRKDRVYLSCAFIAPDAVECVVDRGAYRDIHFKVDRGEEIALNLHTAEDEHTLKQRLGHLRLN